MTAIAFLLMLAGFAAMATTMHATPRALRVSRLRPIRRLAWALIALSLVAALLVPRWGYGLIAWLGLGLPCGLIVAAVLAVARQPRSGRVRPETSAPASAGKRR